MVLTTYLAFTIQTNPLIEYGFEFFFYFLFLCALGVAVVNLKCYTGVAVR